LEAGEKVVIDRPAENSLISVSDSCEFDDILEVEIKDSPAEEIKYVVDSIVAAIKDGLRPDDILVVSVDDRNTKMYLEGLERRLSAKGVKTNNIHGTFGAPDFSVDDHVTLSTVHKAKGNEAYMVFVIGVDALYPNPSGRQRNILFTAMTRAKGWVRVSGSRPEAKYFKAEIKQVKEYFPHLAFIYPGKDQIKVMRRDLEEETSRRLRAERLLEEAASDMSPEEIEEYLRRNLGRLGRSKRIRPKKNFR
jgi:superfamily I DNA and RNA helicase